MPLFEISSISLPRCFRSRRKVSGCSSSQESSNWNDKIAPALLALLTIFTLPFFPPSIFLPGLSRNKVPGRKNYKRELDFKKTEYRRTEVLRSSVGASRITLRARKLDRESELGLPIDGCNCSNNLRVFCISYEIWSSIPYPRKRDAKLFFNRRIRIILEFFFFVCPEVESSKKYKDLLIQWDPSQWSHPSGPHVVEERNIVENNEIPTTTSWYLFTPAIFLFKKSILIWSKSQ